MLLGKWDGVRYFFRSPATEVLRGELDNLLIGEQRRVVQCLLNVFCFQVGVGLQDRLPGFARSRQAQQAGHRESPVRSPAFTRSWAA